MTLRLGVATLTKSRIQQTPRERKLKLVDFTNFLQSAETIDTVAVTVLPPQTAVAQSGFVPPGADQRIVKIDTSTWVFDGVDVTFPLITVEGVGVEVLDDHYVDLFVGGLPAQPTIDFTVAGSQLTFASAPVLGTEVWCNVNAPIIPAGEQRDVFGDPPYSAFDVVAAIVAPDDKMIQLASMGGSAPLVYRARVLAHTSLDQDKEIVVEYEIREP